MRSAPKNRLGYTLEELEKRIESGLMQAHVFPRGVVITQIDNYPEERILHVVLLMGKDLASKWDDSELERIRQFARDNGCNAIEADCRPGLAKFLKQHGFRRTKIKMRNDICPAVEALPKQYKSQIPGPGYNPI